MNQYTKKYQFSKIFQISPSLLNQDIHSYILESLTAYKNCSNEFGYIVSTPKIINIGDYIISPTTGKCKVEVLYECYTFKPEIDHTYNCFIKAIYKEGIFAQTSFIDLLVFIPYTELENFEFKENKFIKDVLELEIEDWIDVQVADVQFHNGSYQCIGQYIQ